MAIIEKRLGDNIKKAWHDAHPKSSKVKLSAQHAFKRAVEMKTIVQWVEKNTNGHSTAELKPFGVNFVTMVWYFEDKSDAVMFKMVWG